MSDELVTERQGPVLLVRLNRPDTRNAINGAVMDGLGRAVVEAEADVGVRAVVLTGTGDRAFCSGMDLRAFASGEQMAAPDPEVMAAFFRLLQGEVTVPFVGAANASALAGGFELLLGCDVIVASSAAAFGLPEVKRGLFAAGGGTSLGTRIPMSVAMEMGLTGDSITAARAYELGLVNAVVDPEQVLPTAIDLAARIAANAPLGLAATKELIRLRVSDPARAVARTQELQQSVFASDDAKEGALAFVEKRPPVWHGR